MALTPEDVVNKRFQPTKFREGYDQDEVDDFLDEVVEELRRLGRENDELRQRLSKAESEHHEAPAPAQAAAPEPAAVPEPTPAPVAAAPEPTPAPVAASALGGTPGVDPDQDTEGTSNLLQLARRLHEEHVREGIEKRDSLIAEGHATAARIVQEAETEQRQRTAVLEQERKQVENRIEELRTFERDYRSQLKGYIQNQLHELDNQGSEQPSGYAPTPANAGADSAPASFQGFGSN